MRTGSQSNPPPPEARKIVRAKTGNRKWNVTRSENQSQQARLTGPRFCGKATGHERSRQELPV